MKLTTILLVAIGVAGWPLFGQGPAVSQPNIPTMDHEPHHHLVLQNGFVKIFDVRVSPKDSIILHSHDQDTVAIAIGEQLVTVGIPGKPDVHQKNADAQVRLQRSGYVHSTRVDGDTPYHTVAVELLRPQTNFRNLCAEILAGQPLNCPDPAGAGSGNASNQALIGSNETTVRLVRLAPRESMDLAMSLGASSSAGVLIVALDSGTITSASPKDPGKAILPGEFVWFDGGPARLFRNRSDKEARVIEFTFPRS